MIAKLSPEVRAQFYRYRTSAGALKRYLRGERMSDLALRLVAANVIAAGCCRGSS